MADLVRLDTSWHTVCSVTPMSFITIGARDDTQNTSKLLILVGSMLQSLTLYYETAKNY